ncbi:hypothetical protein SESBI_37650 [Sesbania bispinosa]|nr:hypothetical protein SESBI_37650 [Sesbania bispinosa]
MVNSNTNGFGWWVALRRGSTCGRVGGTRKQGKVELDLEELEEMKNRDGEFENWWPVRKG